MPDELHTIGHSNHPLERFLGLLARHSIEAIVDVRRFPGSRKHPHFHKDSFEAELHKAGIDYHWIESLGGRRGKSNKESKNLGLRNDSFRNYADYMATSEFRDGVERLLTIAGQKKTAYLCAEGLFWQCHRRLLSDYLVARHAVIKHIMPNGELRDHPLTEGAVISEGGVTYPGEKSLFEG